jgi:hypothetical protein
MDGKNRVGSIRIGNPAAQAPACLPVGPDLVPIVEAKPARPRGRFELQKRKLE